jgi:hypothetical protein
VAGVLCSAAWLSSVACIVTGAGCGSCSGQVPRPNTILVQSLSVQMLSIGLRRVLRPDPLAISRAYNPTQPDTSGNTRISVLWCRTATIAPWAAEGREAAGSLGVVPPLDRRTVGARNGTRRRQGRQAPAHLRGAKCGAEIAGAGLGRGLCGPPPSSSSLLRGSARRASNGVTLVFYAPLTFRWFRVGRVSGGADSLRRASLASGVCDGLQLTLRPVERVLSRQAGTRRPASSGPSAGAALGREVQEECRASQASRSARLVLATQIDVSAAP